MVIYRQLKYGSIILNYELGRLRTAAAVVFAATLSYSLGYDSLYVSIRFERTYYVHHTFLQVDGKLPPKSL